MKPLELSREKGARELMSSWLRALRSRFAPSAVRLSQLCSRVRPFNVYLIALLIFAASRVVVYLGVNFGTLLTVDPDPGKWDAGDAWYHRLLRWDSGWYAGIASEGYNFSRDPSVESSTAFYPIYPLASYALKFLLDIDGYLAILAVANVASVIVALLMTKFVKDELGEDAAVLSLALFCFFPTSMFLSTGYSEALFLVFALLSLIFLKQERFVLGAVMAGLSLGTRSVGIALLPVVLWELWRRSALPWPRLLAKMALCGVLAMSGLLGYMLFLGIEFGEPFAFAKSQAAWHNGTMLDRVISGLMLRPIFNFNLEFAGWFLLFLGLSVWSIWYLRFGISLYAFGILLVPYLTLGITSSMNRFVLPCFPAFMCMAILCKGRHWLAFALIGIFAALLLRNSALYSEWYWVG